MLQCPQCGSASAVHRSAARTWWERWRKLLTQKRPYRCHACGWRGWDIDFGPRFSHDEMTQAARAVMGDTSSATDLSLDAPNDRRGEIQLDALDFPELNPKPGESH
jgi:transposase-like protein